MLGAVLRFWSFGQLGLTHFDEGVYAMSGLWEQMPGGLGAIDPMVIPYAPAGFPFLIGLSYAVFGVADSSAIFVAIACGIATIPAVAWIARRTFGPGAGAAAATCAAFSLVHVAFSRHALTDAPFLLAWVIAIGAGGWFLERPTLRRALLLGLAVAGVQYFKYNGWLTGIIVAATAVLGAIRSPEERRASRLLSTFGWGLVAAVGAAACYWPWLQFVESHGGYGALMRHHRSYLGAEGTWIPYWSQQLAQNVALSWNAAWRAGFGILALLAAWTATSPSPNLVPDRRVAPMLFLVLLASAAAPAALANLPWWIGLACCHWLLIDSRPAPRMVGVWWLLLSALTPLYHPYARLWLPLHGAGWILVGGLTARAVAWFTSQSQLAPKDLLVACRKDKRLIPGASVAVVCLGAGLFQEARAGALPLPGSWFFEPTTGLRHAVSNLAKTLPKPPARPVRVLARRPVAFYLLVYAGRPFVLEPGLEQLREAHESDRAVVDEAVLAAGADPMATLNGQDPTGAAWRVRDESSLVLDPVTLLDTEPGAVDPRHRDRIVHFWDLIWSSDPRLPAVRGNR